MVGWAMPTISEFLGHFSCIGIYVGVVKSIFLMEPQRHREHRESRKWLTTSTYNLNFVCLSQ